MSVKAVVFDLDDTLFSEHDYVTSGFDSVSKLLESKYGISGAAAELNALFEQNEKGVFDRYIEQHADKLSAETVTELVETYRGHEPRLTLADDVIKTLKTLREKGYKLGIITDGRPDGQHKKIDALGLNGLVDEIIITDELGGEEFRKPDPRAFKIMADKLGVKPEQMLYVGDNPNKDFAVKNHLPIKTIQLKRDDGLYFNRKYYDGILPDRVIYAITGILDLYEVNI